LANADLISGDTEKKREDQEDEQKKYKLTFENRAPIATNEKNIGLQDQPLINVQL